MGFETRLALREPDKIDAVAPPSCAPMRGTYCLVLGVQRPTPLKVGALGRVVFPQGVYAYVGSGLGGIEHRVGRHRSRTKRRHLHIDYLLGNAEILMTVAIPGKKKETECELVGSLLQADGSSVVANGFGSSDCRCPTHLVYFGDVDPGWAMETVSMRVTMLPCVYPRTGSFPRWDP